jgi:hypothetical protein
MDKKVFKKGPIATIISGMGYIIFTAIILIMILIGLKQTEESSRAEGLRLLEEGIFRAVIHCYAVEGHYPESVAYITENYGIHIDENKYVVHYEIFAQNLLPYIMVIELN